MSVNPVNQTISRSVAVVAEVVMEGKSRTRALIRGSVLESIVDRIQALLNDNHHLIFWFSTSMLFGAAPLIFLGGNVIGVLSSSRNYFGLKERRIEHLSWETASGLVSGMAFVAALVYHYHIQCFCGGVAMGSHIQRVWTGKVHGRTQKGWKGMDREMTQLAHEFFQWVPLHKMSHALGAGIEYIYP